MHSFSSFIAGILLGINFDIDSEFKECFIDSVEDRVKSMYSKSYLFFKICNLMLYVFDFSQDSRL